MPNSDSFADLYNNKNNNKEHANAQKPKKAQSELLTHIKKN